MEKGESITISCPFDVTYYEWMELMAVINKAAALYKNGKFNNINITLNENQEDDH